MCISLLGYLQNHLECSRLTWFKDYHTVVGTIYFMCHTSSSSFIITDMSMIIGKKSIISLFRLFLYLDYLCSLSQSMYFIGFCFIVKTIFLTSDSWDVHTLFYMEFTTCFPLIRNIFTNLDTDSSYLPHLLPWF